MSGRHQLISKRVGDFIVTSQVDGGEGDVNWSRRMQ